MERTIPKYVTIPVLHETKKQLYLEKIKNDCPDWDTLLRELLLFYRKNKNQNEKICK
jgi:hypothetical protein